jgi:predicted secreted protein
MAAGMLTTASLARGRCRAGREAESGPAGEVDPGRDGEVIPMLHLDENHPGDRVELALGDELELVLPENRTTGHRWHPGLDEASVLEVVDDSFLPPVGGVGSGGHHRWLFRAARPGAGMVELTYRRPWEAAVSRRFAVDVLVKS